MTDLGSAMQYALLAGLCIPLGGLLGSLHRLRPRWLEEEIRHAVIAMGGGALLGALAMTLLPEGSRMLDAPFIAVGAFVSGGLSFFWLERRLGLRRREAPQFTGMMLDYVPEALALGGLAASGSASTVLLAVLIGVQNLPEGFNAYRELNHHHPRFNPKLLLRMLALAPIGPLMVLFGHQWLDAHPALLGAIMLFACGGLLYLIFQDIAPQARLDRHWAPPLGAVFGFAIALIGSEWLGAPALHG